MNPRKPPSRNITNEDLIFGDFDRDRVPNLDDPHPFAYKKGEKEASEIPLTNEFRIMRDATRATKPELKRIIKSIRKRHILPRNAQMSYRTKSINSLLNKLRKYQLPITDDLGGGRITLQTENDLHKVEQELRKMYPQSEILDYYSQPKHGYRAVHFLIPIKPKSDLYPKRVEIQLRTPRTTLISDAFHTSYKTMGASVQGQTRYEELMKLAVEADRGNKYAIAQFEQERSQYIPEFFK